MAFSITKDDETTDKCRELAKEDNRSVSNYLEILVQRDWRNKEEIIKKRES
jgi:predicted transcriptional regulator